MKTIVKKKFLEDNHLQTSSIPKTLLMLEEFKLNPDKKKIQYHCDCNLEINKKHKENCIYNLV